MYKASIKRKQDDHTGDWREEMKLKFTMLVQKVIEMKDELLRTYVLEKMKLNHLLQHQGILGQFWKDLNSRTIAFFVTKLLHTIFWKKIRKILYQNEIQSIW